MRSIVPVYFVSFLFFSLSGISQQIPIQQNKNTYTWVSINSNWYLYSRYFLVGDLHIRENNFFKSNSFLFGRIGVGYQIKPNLNAIVGLATLHLTSYHSSIFNKLDEKRIYQQIGMNINKRRYSISHRLRNEFRWQDQYVNDVKNGDTKFSDRVRYLISANFSLFKNNHLPQLSLSNELLFQFGKNLAVDVLDQNRVFVGIKQKINNAFSFDLGYMNVYQPRLSTNTIYHGDVMRMFFYYTFKNSRN